MIALPVRSQRSAMNAGSIGVSSILTRLLRDLQVCPATCGLDTRIEEQLLPGTRLIVHHRAYFHSGIYVGNGRVIHYAGWFRCARGLIEEVTIERFTRGRPCGIGRTPANRQIGEQIVQRARSRLGERRYHLLRNNCEHFCNWCQLGELRSEQVEALTRAALLFFPTVQSRRQTIRQGALLGPA